MDNLYGDFKPSLNEIENQSNQTANQTDGLGAAAANKPISSFPKTEFKLSPHAPAFVPRFASVAQQMPSYYENNTEYDQNFPGLGNGYQSGGGQMIQQPQGLQEPNFVGASADEGGAVKLPNEMLKEDDYYALNELNNFIENISKNPALYEANVQLETDVLNNWIVEDPDIIMECVVNNIMDQAIMDNNFRYNGVRFCLHLISNLHVNSSKGSFKQVLLQRCKREHSRRDTLSNASDNGLYLRGLTFFIGDLSTRLNESELTLAVPDLLKTLLQNKSSDNVKCCCQILKLCGKHMSEFLTNNGSLQVIDELIEELVELAGKAETENSVRNLINNTVELYKNNWETPQSNTPIYNPYAKGNQNSAAMGRAASQVPEFVDSYDQELGYDFGPCGDGKNEDVCDAFEEFLKASGQL